MCFPLRSIRILSRKLGDLIFRIVWGGTWHSLGDWVEPIFLGVQRDSCTSPLYDAFIEEKWEKMNLHIGPSPHRFRRWETLVVSWVDGAAFCLGGYIPRWNVLSVRSRSKDDFLCGIDVVPG